MGNDLFSYMARMEIMIFFAGYTIVYAFVFFLAGEFQKKSKSFLGRLPGLLPIAYALCGTFFLGFIMQKIYVGYGMNVPVSQLNHPLLILWGLGAMLFWLKLFRKLPVLSLLHSLVYFYFIPRDMYLKYSGAGGSDLVRNDMNILTTSLLLNTGCLLIIMMFHFVIIYKREKN